MPDIYRYVKELMSKDERKRPTPAKPVSGTGSAFTGASALPAAVARASDFLNGIAAQTPRTVQPGKPAGTAKGRVGAMVLPDGVDQAQITRVGKLPADFPIDQFDGMTTKEQLKAMKYSGLNEQDQWRLLNSAMSLQALSLMNAALKGQKSGALSGQDATDLFNRAYQYELDKNELTRGNASILPPLQKGVLRRELDSRKAALQAMIETDAPRLYPDARKLSQPPIVTAPTETTDEEDIEESKEYFSSRDAMDRKKDGMWEKVEKLSSRDAMDRMKDRLWKKVEAEKPTLPVNLPKPLQKYTWYDSYEKAADMWAKINRPFSKDLERCALIYQYIDRDGDVYYTFGKTKTGMEAIPELNIRDNVAAPFVGLYLSEILPYTTRVGFIHTHPDLPNNDQFSNEDRFLKKLPGVDFISVAPYGKDKVLTE